MRTLLWLKLFRFPIMIDGLVELLHDEGNVGDELVEDWISADILDRVLQNLVRLRKVRILAQDV